MDWFRNTKLANITLFFFYWMTFFPLAYADTRGADVLPVAALSIPAGSRVYYVTPEQAQQLQREWGHQGYVVQRHAPDQLQAVYPRIGSDPTAGLVRVAQSELQSPTTQHAGTAVSAVGTTATELPESPTNQSSDPRTSNATSGSAGQSAPPNTECQPGAARQEGAPQQQDKPAGDRSAAAPADANDNEEAATATTPGNASTPSPCADPTPTEPAPTINQQPAQQSEPEQYPPRTHHPSGDIYIRGDVGAPLPDPPLPNLKLPDLGKNSGDAAIILFVVVGVVVVAVLVVYAIKGLISAINGKDQQYTWTLGLQSDVLAADGDQHGRFFGAKLSTGYIADKALYIGLAGELGQMDIDLDVTQGKTNTRLQLVGNYWMLGAEMRLGNYSQPLDGVSVTNYMFLEFMGGTSEFAATDVIGSAKIGGNFRLFDNFRLGLSIGSRYFGLSKNEGFAGSRDNYWLNYGVDVSYRF